MKIKNKRKFFKKAPFNAKFWTADTDFSKQKSCFFYENSLIKNIKKSHEKNKYFLDKE